MQPSPASCHRIGPLRSTAWPGEHVDGAEGWKSPRSPESLQPIQPLTKSLESRLQFLLCFRRYLRCLRKVSEHVGIALFRTGNRACGVFLIATVILGSGQACKREAHLQVSPDEIKANPLNLVPKSQPFVEQVTHVHILGDHGPRCFPAPACKVELA